VTPGRVVLDTNVVVSALVFTSGRPAWVRHAWQRSEVVPVVCTATVAELLPVLAYPRLRLDERERDVLLGDFLSSVEVIELTDPWPDVPDCRDPADRVFLALAVATGADALITGDADLLAIGHVGQVPIMTPEMFAAAR